MVLQAPYFKGIIMKVTAILISLLTILDLAGMDIQDPHNQRWDAKSFHKATKQSLSFAKKKLDEFDWSKHSAIVDIGCGPGALTAHIAKRARHASVAGMDPSESMIKFAQGYYQKPSNLYFCQRELPSMKDYWDFIFSCNAFHLLTREKQVAALKQLAACSKYNVSLFIIMAAKTDVPQAFSRAYAATVSMPRWEKLRAINLDNYFQPHSIESFKQLANGTGWVIREIGYEDEHIQFKNAKGLKKFIASWMGGFEFVAQLPKKEQKKLIKDLVANYCEEVPLGLDGSADWRSPRLIVLAERQ